MEATQRLRDLVTWSDGLAILADLVPWAGLLADGHGRRQLGMGRELADDPALRGPRSSWAGPVAAEFASETGAGASAPDAATAVEWRRWSWLSRCPESCKEVPETWWK